ncbi:TIGR03087 family PEP-CTERM/XrtA system glycosyltransferase [Sphingorhabdus arenilitoris]|uniref:TIGR03087 family PEP-CTERM/XrtA system glycosyltransferase n=1 Tax=Sphingorhabdus arenilitoris TaxID=1490041 RepID=A0ABV8RE44_9SPHN
MVAEILFLAHRIPWPADRGDKIRSYHILQHLAQMGPVHVGSFADDDRDMSFVAEMEPNFASVHAEKRVKPQWQAGLEALRSGRPISVESFASPSMANWVNSVLASRPISHIFVFSGQMAQYIPDDFAGRIIMDFVDVDSAKFERYASEGGAFMRWVNRREGRLLAAFEHQVAARADASLFVSEAEAALFRQRSGLSADIVLPIGNGIDTISYDPLADIPRAKGVPRGKIIMFTGQMDYRPNIEAVDDFARRAMPAILQRHADAKFIIVGRSPTDAVKALANLPGVTVTGAVDDVRSWLTAAHVVAAPLRIARGIQNKVLEAMAMAKPVVASAAAAEGIEATDGVHFHVAANIGEEIEKICALLSDAEAAKRLGISARLHVQQHYSWDGQLAPLDALMSIKPLREAAE